MKAIKTDQWWDVNWNPLKGCPDNGDCECADICWAHGLANKKSMAYRFHRKNELSFDPKLAIPKGEGKVIFANNTSDAGHPEVTDYMRYQIYMTQFEHSEHIFINLSKRPLSIFYFLYKFKIQIASLLEILGNDGSNVWQGVTITSPSTLWRLNILKKIPLKRLLSLEPLSAPLPNLDLSGINWVIVGPDSSNTWPCEAEWIMDIVSQCKTAKVPVFVKGIKYLQPYSSTPATFRLLETQEYPIWK